MTQKKKKTDSLKELMDNIEFECCEGAEEQDLLINKEDAGDDI